MQNLFSIGQTHSTRRAPGSHKSATAPTAYVTRHAVSTYRRHVATLLGAAPCKTFGACFQLAVTRSTILNEQEARACTRRARRGAGVGGSQHYRYDGSGRAGLVAVATGSSCADPHDEACAECAGGAPPARIVLAALVLSRRHRRRSPPAARRRVEDDIGCSRPPVRYDWTSAGSVACCVLVLCVKEPHVSPCSGASSLVTHTLRLTTKHFHAHEKNITHGREAGTRVGLSRRLVAAYSSRPWRPPAPSSCALPLPTPSSNTPTWPRP